MEKISTSRAALLPRAANLATLAVVVAATWWSGAQRPVGQAATLAGADESRVVETAETLAQRQPAAPSTVGTVATWPAQAATTLARDGLQAVGYQTRAHR